MSTLSNYYPYTYNLDFYDGDYSGFVSKLIHQIQQIESQHTAILFGYEFQPFDQLLSTMAQIAKSCKCKIICVLDTQWLYLVDRTIQQMNDSRVGAEFVELDLDLLPMHFELSVYKSSILNLQWNPDAGKFLFLTGKPDRHNRLRLLYKFYEQDLLKHCTWSMFMDDTLRQQSQKFLSELSDQDYNNFIDTHINNPDSVSVVYETSGTCHCDGYPFSGDLYSQTSFRVIAETQIGLLPAITEKTYITIANRHPFIIAGHRHNLSYLKNLGFQTFEHYLKIKDYDSIVDRDQRLNAVVENTQHLLATMPKHQDQIAQDVEHNYQLLLAYLNKTAVTFDSIYRKLGPVEFEPFRIFPLPTQRATWINFYYGIKDSSWPDCFSEKDFNSLPVEIQKECIDVYGYTPT